MSNTEITHPLERYRRIADPTIRQQCIENFDEEYYESWLEKSDGSVEFAVMWGFNWTHSEQKYAYWSDVYDKIKEGTLPLLPDPIEEPLNEPKQISREEAQTTPHFQTNNGEFIDLTILDQLRSENEKLRECLEILLSSYLVQVKGDNRNTYAVDQAKQLLNK